MSLQVFLQAQILGSEGFLASFHSGENEAADDLIGRCAWLTLIGEVLPRALLAELKLSRMLLGSSSAEQFLLVLPEEDSSRANEFLMEAAARIAQLSAGTLRLVWASTENLGSWPVVRKRIDDALASKICCPVPEERSNDLFAPFLPASPANIESSFASLAAGLVSATSVGWATGDPILLTWDGGTFSWPLREQSSVEEDGILFPRRIAVAEKDTSPAPLSELAGRADGAERWGILRGDVDHFEPQLRRAGSVEEHIHFSALFKE